MTKFVQHISGKGDIWEVVDDLGDEWEVKSQTDERDSHYLPKSEFVEKTGGDTVRILTAGEIDIHDHGRRL